MKVFSRTAIACLALIALPACTTAQIAAMDGFTGMGVLESSQDAFDGTSRVRVSPAYVAKPDGQGGLAWVAGFRVGAQWLGDIPQTVSLILEIDGIEGISGIGVNVNGQVTDYKTRRLTSMDTDSSVSTGYAYMPFEQFVQLVESDSTMLRLYTLDGYIDARFDSLRGRGGALTARHYLRTKFLPEVRVKLAAL